MKQTNAAKKPKSTKKEAGGRRKVADEPMMSTEARAEYGFSRDMMTKLLRSGALPFTIDPVDKRIKWVNRSEVEEIVSRSRKLQRAASATKKGR